MTIRNHGGPADDVYDPFVGSGTTLIAAEQLHRRCFALEIEPKYVQVALERWAKLSGQQPVHEATGKTFEALKAERQGV